MSGMTFCEAAERYERKLSDKGRKPDANKRSILKRLKERIGDLPLDEIDRMYIDDLHAWLATKETRTGGTYSVSTIAGHLAYLKAMLRWANEAGKLEKVPVVKVPKGKQRDQFLEPEEVKMLIAELDPWRSDLVRFGFYTGLRKTNCTHLRWDQLEKDFWVVAIEGTETKNGNKFRTVLGKSARKVILRRLARADWLEEEFGWRSEFVFPKDHSNKPSFNVCDGTWRKAVARAGLPAGTCFHTLRHSFASMHMRREVPEQVIQEMGGWQNSAMLKRYAHIKDEQKRKAAEGLDGLLD
tara:strand:- start:3462 stop:4352 length:891 start_codon:yes stop_codon:yes gene_type:complete